MSKTFTIRPEMIILTSSLKVFPFDKAWTFIQTAQFFVQKQIIVLYLDWIQVSSFKMSRKSDRRGPQCVSKVNIMTINIFNTIKLHIVITHDNKYMTKVGSKLDQVWQIGYKATTLGIEPSTIKKITAVS